MSGIPDILRVYSQLTAVGSRVTCNPPATGTDQDWLVLVDEKQYLPLAEWLLSNGWDVGGSMIPADVDSRPQNERFNSFTKGDDNLIVTASDEFHRRFLAASSVAKRFNLINKSDRIALFQAVLYGYICLPEFDVSVQQSEEDLFA